MTTETMANDLLMNACGSLVTDIYFFPKEDMYLIEARNDQGKYKVADFTLDEVLAIINFLKFNSGLDVSERRRPQKGSFSFYFQNNRIHIRISTVGDFKNRESMVVRLIYPHEFNAEVNQDILEELLPIARRKGMMIFAGPMGSGKTSLMYSLGRQLVDKQVMCIEDPIEIVEDQFLQLQVNEDSGMSYEELIKASLRHRPEVLIIGEIRDSNTAKQAMQAALCGYTVMTTIHGKSKYSVIQRLKQFGIEDPDILNAVNSISYQRLIPTISQIELFIDLMEQNDIKKFIETNEVDNNWTTMIQNTLKNGYIDENTYQEYLYG
ncbi:competence type IV pilus ATPase ComGA [Companilactobacillus sp. HBUAS59699]|uniref:competence type IV pilus ATPase ComGA n=1 Tax=Companilactobacillus sp. HBUAS59699 TaxID=3109358 RepID=UPI002FEEF7BD